MSVAGVAISTSIANQFRVYMISPHYPGFQSLITIYPVSWAFIGILMGVLYAVHWRK